jgi:hypothetical protein
LVLQGICSSCPPTTIDVKNKKESSTHSSQNTELELEPLLVTLLVCFHCKKKLCESCRNRHYIQQRQETANLIDNCQIGSANILVTSEKLNEARKLKIEEYNKTKLNISELKLELIKRIDQEEKNLLARLDEEIANEQKFNHIFYRLFLYRILYFKNLHIVR